MGFKPRKGDAPPTGRIRPSVNFERTMALASQIAAESVPDEHTVSANEQAPAVVERGVLAAPTPMARATPASTSGATSPVDVGSSMPSRPSHPGEESDAGSERAATGRRGAAGAAALESGGGSANGRGGTTDLAHDRASDLATEPLTAATTEPAAERAGVRAGESSDAEGAPAPGAERDRERSGGGGVALTSMPVDSIRKSPFQPKGRPSHEAVAAVAQAIERAGGIERLVGADGQSTFQSLSPEAKRLAELTYSVARDGVRDPIEVRRAEDGVIEALSGHRRLAAAMLIGMQHVPILDRGALSSLQAAATVLSGNLHREDFTPWQEAVLVTEVVAQRRADGLPADVRTIGAIMGYSHGRVSTLLAIRRVVSDAVLERLGEPAAIEEALARYANYSRLEEIARLPDESRREQALRRVLGVPVDAAGGVDERLVDRVYDHRPKRRGGFTIEVFRPIEQLAPHDASALRELFASQLARLDARLHAAGERRQ